MVDENAALLAAFGPEAPRLIRYRSSKAFILITVCLALFTDSFIYGVLVPVLPFMLKNRCHVKDGSEQLWTSALFAVFGAAILIGSPICGHFADHSQSRRLPLLLGIPILAGATVLIGLGESVWILLASRLLQGFSTAVTWTVGLALTRDTAGKAEVGQWMGTALSSSSVGLIISPLLGGIVFAGSGVWGVLTMMIALVILNVIFVFLDPLIKDTTPAYGTFATQRSIDFLIPTKVDHKPCQCPSESTDSEDEEAVCSSCSHTEDEQETWDAASVLPEEEMKRRMHPMLRLLRSPRVMTGAYGVFTQFGILASFDAFLPLFVERRFNWSSLGAGLIFLNLAFPALTGPLAGKLSDRFGPRRIALAGCVLTAPPLFLIRFVGYDTKEQVAMLCCLLVLIGFSLTLIISPLAADLSFAVDQIELDEPGLFGEKGAYAQAYALFDCAMAAATVVGPILAGGLQDAYGTPAVALMMSIWCISAAVPVIFFIGDGEKTQTTDIETPVNYHRLSISSRSTSIMSFSRPASMMAHSRPISVITSR